MVTWGEKRFYSLDYYIKKNYEKKLYKLSLNAGFTCPNRDGTLDSRGCIFCSAGGSGDFAGKVSDSIATQLTKEKHKISNKVKVDSYIAYFQAFTNTYSDVDTLRAVYQPAIEDDSIAIISIATRPDCLDEDILNLLESIHRIKPVWVELGLQSSSEESSHFIRRGYPLSVFEVAVQKLRSRGLHVIVHTIIGLPSEPKTGILDTIRYLNTLDIQGIKLQLLHVLEHTDLAIVYQMQPFWIPTLEEYLELIASCISILRPDIVIHRLTGDGDKKILIAPLWSLNKRKVLNGIQQYLKSHDIWQGKNNYN